MTILGFTIGVLMIVPMAASTRAGAIDKPAFSKTPGEVSSQFTVSDKTQIPGHTLKRGSYTITIVDHLSDRMILRVDRDGKTEATFLALPVSSLPAQGKGPITITGGNHTKEALRGFAFADGTIAEFVFPKVEAVALAKANATKIPAIDPGSEGRPDKTNLSQDDLQMVTLWMLSPTRVGPDSNPGVLAEKYHQPEVAGTTPVLNADASPKPSASARTSAVVSNSAGSQTQVASVQVPPRPTHRAKPLLTVLPHTAGTSPLIEFMGLAALLAAAALTTRRKTSAC